MLTMNGHQFEFDLFELETAKKYEKALANTINRIENAKEQAMLSESIELQCDAIRTCIDEIFGDGTGAEVCDKSETSCNLTKHLDAFEALVDEAVEQRTRYEERALKYIQEQSEKTVS